MAQQAGMGVNHQDTLAVPPMPKHSGLNEDLVKIDPTNGEKDGWRITGRRTPDRTRTRPQLEPWRAANTRRS